MLSPTYLAISLLEDDVSGESQMFRMEVNWRSQSGGFLAELLLLLLLTLLASMFILWTLEFRRSVAALVKVGP
jgi:hypothetical protein